MTTPLPENPGSIEAAHALLDEHGFPRTTPVNNMPMTIYGRLVQRLPHKPSPNLWETFATAQHTPGPWLVNYSRRPYGVQASASTCTLGFVFRGHIEDPEGTQEANARLIAAAPDLLEALQTALPYLSTVLSTGEQGPQTG